MKLKEYAKKIAALATQYPDVKVVYSSDDEGNQFDEVNYDPSAGQYKDGQFDNSKKKINAVCVN